MNDHHKQNDAAAGTPVSARTALVITRFEKPASDGPMTKRIWPDVNGELASDGGGGGMWRGKAEVITVEGAAGLAEAIGACKSQQAFAMGIVKPELAGVRDEIRAWGTKKVLTAAPPGTIARKRRNISGSRPDSQARCCSTTTRRGCLGKRRVEPPPAAGGFREAVIDVAPGLAEAAWVVRASTSAGLVDTTDGEGFPGQRRDAWVYRGQGRG